MARSAASVRSKRKTAVSVRISKYSPKYNTPIAEMQTVSVFFSYEECNRPVDLVLVKMIELNDGGDNAILASDRGKIVEKHRKQRNDALSLTSKVVTGPGYGRQGTAVA